MSSPNSNPGSTASRRMPRLSAGGIMAGGALLVIFLVAVIAPIWLGPDALKAHPEDIGVGVSSDHWLGTDALGRDVLSRVLVATRSSVGMALFTTALSSVAGILIGAFPLVLTGRPRRMLVGVINATVAMPGLLVAIFLAMILGKGQTGAVLSLSVASIPSVARLTFAAASRVANSNYVAAATKLGTSRLRIIVRHILPNVFEPLMVNSTAMVGSTLIALSALSYLGFGINPPKYDWGTLLQQGLPDLYLNPASALGPAIAIVLTGTAFTFAGEHLTELFVRDSQRSSRSSKRAWPVIAHAGEPLGGDDALEVRDLVVEVMTRDGLTPAVRGVSFRLDRGEIVGVVGESGSGKSLMVSALADMLPLGADSHSSRFTVLGTDVRALGRRQYRLFMGKTFGMVFQDPMNSMTPTMRVGPQLTEGPREHLQLSMDELRKRALEQLTAVHLDAPARRMRQYPWELSGGMAQRTTIAMGLMTDPAVILADEPTTALDVTIQAEVVRLLKDVSERRGISIVFVSHDIAVVSTIAHRVVVMYGGMVIEELRVEDLASGGRHPYTRALLSSIPTMGADKSVPLNAIGGRPPSLGTEPPGCPFQPRCARATDRCATEMPPLLPTRTGALACFNPHEPDVAAIEDRRLADDPVA